MYIQVPSTSNTIIQGKAPKRINGGWAFTSAECIKFLEEKEAQKQKDKEKKQKEKRSVKLEKKKGVKQRIRKKHEQCY